MILKAEPLDPSFKWCGHKPERRPWRSITLLLAIAVGAGFFVGRLSTAAPVPTAQRTLEQQTATTGSVAQSQGALLPDAAVATRSSTITDTKPAAKEETKANAAASFAETPKTRSAAATEKGSSSPPVLLINPSTAEKGVVGEATKKAVPKGEIETPVKATAKTEMQKAVDDAVSAATASKRQARPQSPAHWNGNAAPVRQESAAPRRDDAYVAPRVPQAAYGERDQRERFDSIERDDDRARLEQRYPDRRYAEDVPLPRDGYEDRRGYLRPFHGARDFSEYRRFDRYDDDAYAERRPVLRPMYGGGPNY